MKQGQRKRVGQGGGGKTPPNFATVKKLKKEQNAEE